MLKIVIKPLVATVSCYFEGALSNTFSMRINYIIFYLRMHVLNPYDMRCIFSFSAVYTPGAVLITSKPTSERK